MGVRPFGAPLISDDLASAIEYEGHTRIPTLDSDNAENELRSRGLQEVPKRRWVASPSVETPGDLIERHRCRLNVAADAGELEGLQLLDSAANVLLLPRTLANACSNRYRRLRGSSSAGVRR